MQHMYEYSNVYVSLVIHTRVTFSVILWPKIMPYFESSFLSWPALSVEGSFLCIAAGSERCRLRKPINLAILIICQPRGTSRSFPLFPRVVKKKFVGMTSNSTLILHLATLEMLLL